MQPMNALHINMEVSISSCSMKLLTQWWRKSAAAFSHVVAAVAFNDYVGQLSLWCCCLEPWSLNSLLFSLSCHRKLYSTTKESTRETNSNQPIVPFSLKSVNVFKRHNSQNYVRVLLKNRLVLRAWIQSYGFPIMDPQHKWNKMWHGYVTLHLKVWSFAKWKQTSAAFPQLLGKTLLMITSLNLKDF